MFNNQSSLFSLRKSNHRNGMAAYSACIGVLAALWSQQSQAVQLTFDLRATSTTGGTIDSGKTVNGAANGTVITVQLFAIINGLDATQLNDGILSGGGSFLSLGSLAGTTGTWLAFDGTATYGTAVNTDAAPAFRGALSQNGSLAATDTTFGGFELGRDNAAVDAATPSPNPYFKYVSNAVPTATFGTQAIAGTTEFLLGTKTFRIDTAVTSSISLQFAGRNTTALSKEIKFTLDGVAKTFNGTDANIGYGTAITIAAVPEPSAFGMLALGALGLVGFRRMGLRRTA